jgi:hypothetical protein
MKRFLTVLTVILVGMTTQSSVAQIPNAGFETWSMGNPVDWNTSNAIGIAVNITQSSMAHSGSSAVSGVVADFSGFPWPPVIISGANAEGFPVSARHEAVHGWYQSDLVGMDVIAVYVAMAQGDSAVGGGIAIISTSTSTYTEFAANITYFSPLVPDTCIISVSISSTGGGLPEIGSSFLVDDLFFGALTAVDDAGNAIPETYSLSQNYPNPFNPSTTIQYSIPHSGHVSLVVYDLLGSAVSVLVDDEQSAGSYRVNFDAASLPSGIYYYRLESGSFSQTRNLVLIR